jgi:predicted RNase H-like nuclease
MGGERRYVGAHWTGGAWVAAGFDDRSFDRVDVVEEVGQLWVRYEERAERLLLDVPVGLVEEGDPERTCDRLAREALGPRADAVVAPPVREATKKRRYPAAKRVTERKTDRGGLSRAAFERSQVIAAVDEFVQGVPEARSVVAETHPEVCFRAFAGEPMAHARGTAAGYAERLRTLAEFDRDAAPAVQAAAAGTAGHAVTVADVLDAMALGYTARPGPGELRRLPPSPPADADGLPMALAYRASAPLSPADADDADGAGD